MNRARALWERRKNPLSWVAQSGFFVLLCFGCWWHSGTLIALAVFGVATSWFWFPKPRHVSPFVERGLNGKLTWLKKPMDARKTTEMLASSVALGGLLVALWQHAWVLASIAFALVLTLKVLFLRKFAALGKEGT